MPGPSVDPCSSPSLSSPLLVCGGGVDGEVYRVFFVVVVVLLWGLMVGCLVGMLVLGICGGGGYVVEDFWVFQWIIVVLCHCIHYCWYVGW